MCKKINSRPYRYPTESDLRKYQFNDGHPFTAVGVDYLGPIDAAPWWGGIWERLVASVKCLAEKVIGLQRLLFI